jgi:hypothetical protein
MLTINILFCGVNLIMIISLLMSEMVLSFIYIYVHVKFPCGFLRLFLEVYFLTYDMWGCFCEKFQHQYSLDILLWHVVTYWSFVTWFNCISYFGNGLVPNFVSDFPLLVCLFLNFLHQLWIVFGSIYNLYSPLYQADNGGSVCFRQVFPVRMLHCSIMEKSALCFESWNYYCRPRTMVLLHKCKILQSVCLT